MRAAWLGRVERANTLIMFIANCGLRKFWHAGMVSRFGMVNETLWFYEGRVGGVRKMGTIDLGWAFSDGPILLQFVRNLNRYIREGDKFYSVLGPFPIWKDGGDPWGYGADMALVRERAIELGIYEVQS